MTAERLRLAATRLREVAEAAGGNNTRWAYTDNAHSRGDEFYANVTQSAWDVACCPGGDTAPHEGRRNQAIADATYIATMSPPVALALADWLDHEARVREESDRQKVHFPYVRAIQSDAVADAILGGE